MFFTLSNQPFSFNSIHMEYTSSPEEHPACQILMVSCVENKFGNTLSLKSLQREGSLNISVTFTVSSFINILKNAGSVLIFSMSTVILGTLNSSKNLITLLL